MSVGHEDESKGFVCAKMIVGAMVGRTLDGGNEELVGRGWGTLPRGLVVSVGIPAVPDSTNVTDVGDRRAASDNEGK